MSYRRDEENGVGTVTVKGALHETDLLMGRVTDDADAAWRRQGLSAGTPPDPQKVREFDALIALAGLDPDGKRRKPLVVVHTTTDLVHAWDATGTPVAGSLLDRLLGQCKLEVRVGDALSGNVQHHAAADELPDWVRNAVLDRDLHSCTWPGCRSTIGLHVHHIRFRRHGGKHDFENLTTLCSFHHHRIHDHGFAVTGPAPHALAFYRPDGSLLLAAGQSGWHLPPFLEEVALADEAARAHVEVADLADAEDAVIARLRTRQLRRSTTRPPNPGRGAPPRRPVSLRAILFPDEPEPADAI